MIRLNENESGAVVYQRISIVVNTPQADSYDTQVLV